MNYLAHLLLSPADDDSRIGSVLADFARIGDEGLDAAFGGGVAGGIRAHRRIDDFTDTHPVVSEAAVLLAVRHRHAARIVVDILYDHFLLVHWDMFCDEPSGSFIDCCHDLLLRRGAVDTRFPERFRVFCRRAVERNVLRSYATLDGIAAVLEHVSTRADCLATIAHARVDIEQHYAALENSFLRFFPLVCEFARVSGR